MRPDWSTVAMAKVPPLRPAPYINMHPQQSRPKGHLGHKQGSGKGQQVRLKPQHSLGPKVSPRPAEPGVEHSPIFKHVLGPPIPPVASQSPVSIPLFRPGVPKPKGKDPSLKSEIGEVVFPGLGPPGVSTQSKSPKEQLNRSLEKILSLKQPTEMPSSDAIPPHRLGDTEVSDHTEVPPGEGPEADGKYDCVYCGKRFQTRSGVRKHTSKHTGHYLYYCEHCEKGFNEIHDYEAHMNRHKGIGFRCMKCNRSLFTMALLVKHQEKCTEMTT